MATAWGYLAILIIVVIIVLLMMWLSRLSNKTFNKDVLPLTFGIAFVIFGIGIIVNPDLFKGV